MEIVLKENPEQLELMRCMGSTNPAVAREATEAIAAFLGPVVRKVLMTAGTVAKIYRDVEYDEDSDPSIPVDLFYAEGEGYVTVWSQNVAGGLPTSQVTGFKELKFGTYRIDAGVSFNKKYARKARLDVLSKAVERLINEVLIKQERNGWAVILKGIAEAYTVTQPNGNLVHAIATATPAVFQLKDLSNLMTRIKRINSSYSSNTPVAPYTYGMTDLYTSPETKAQIRAFAYNPVDTSSGNTVQNLPQNLREEIYRTAGMQSIFGVNIVEMNEFGIGQKYNVLFNKFTTAGGNGFAQAIPGNNGGAWSATDEIMVGIDNTRGALLRPIARQSDSGGTFTVLPDGQFEMYGTRVSKVGFYGFLEEARVLLDARALSALIL